MSSRLCTAAVVTGTYCLPSTTGRCTWCGRPMRPQPRPVRKELADYWWAVYRKESLRGFGTDPVAYVEQGDVPDYWLTGASA